MKFCHFSHISSKRLRHKPGKGQNGIEIPYNSLYDGSKRRQYHGADGRTVQVFMIRAYVLINDILLGQGITVKDTLPQVGYSSALTMNRAFRRFEDTTPGAFYREK